MSEREARSILKTMNIEYSVEAMCEAAENDDVKIIELFHRSGASLDTECMWAPILFQSVDYVSKRVFRYLIDNGADINGYSKFNYKTVFVEALSNGRFDWAYELLSLGVNTKKIEPEGGINDMIPLVWALQNCDNNLVKAVLKNGASPNDSTGIHMALSMVPRNCTQVLLTLIQAGADVNLRKDATHTPLITYVIDGNYDYVKILLENGADVDTIINEKDAAYYAVITNQFDILLTLSKHDANLKKLYLLDYIMIPLNLRANKKLVERLTTKGLTLLEIAKLIDYKEIYDFLLKEQGISS